MPQGGGCGCTAAKPGSAHAAVAVLRSQVPARYPRTTARHIGTPYVYWYTATMGYQPLIRALAGKWLVGDRVRGASGREGTGMPAVCGVCLSSTASRLACRT